MTFNIYGSVVKISVIYAEWHKKAIMLSVIMLGVIVLSIAAPFVTVKHTSLLHRNEKYTTERFYQIMHCSLYYKHCYDHKLCW